MASGAKYAIVFEHPTDDRGGHLAAQAENLAPVQTEGRRVSVNEGESLLWCDARLGQPDDRCHGRGNADHRVNRRSHTRAVIQCDGLR